MSDGNEDFETQVRALLQPWHPFDIAWLDAEVVVTGTLRVGSYPCIFHEDGSSEMPLARTITVKEVLRKGSLARDDFDFSAPSDPALAFPYQYLEGRSFLVFLRADATKHLADRDHTFGVFTQLGQSDLIAIVDLDQTKEEAAAHRTEVETWQRRERFELTADSWRALRQQQKTSTEEIATTLHALREHRLDAWCKRQEVRDFLGDPDETKKKGEETIEVYFVSAAERAAPSEGAIVASVSLTYDARGLLVEYADDFEICSAGKVRDATYEEKRERGLIWILVDRRRSSPCR